MNMFYYQFFISVCICLSRFLRPVVTEVRSGVAGFIVWSSTRYRPTLSNIFAINDGLIERNGILSYSLVYSRLTFHKMKQEKDY